MTEELKKRLEEIFSTLVDKEEYFDTIIVFINQNFIEKEVLEKLPEQIEIIDMHLCFPHKRIIKKEWILRALELNK